MPFARRRLLAPAVVAAGALLLGACAGDEERSGVAAVVGDSVIETSEVLAVSEEVSAARSQPDVAGVDVQAPPVQEPAEVAALQRQVLQFLTVAEIFEQVGARFGVEVPQGQVQDVLDQAGQQPGGLDQLAAQLGAPSLSLVDEALRVGAIQQQLQGLPDQEQAQAFFEEVVQDVEINPRYGRLDLQAGVVAPDRDLSEPLGGDPAAGTGLELG